MTIAPQLLLVLALGAGALGCSKNKGAAAAAAAAPDGGAAPATAASPTHVTGTPQTDQVVDSLKSAGLPVEAFAALQPVPYGASTCQQGKVQGIDTLICEYADPGSLDRGKKLLHDDWDQEGVQTGVATSSGQTLLAIADRGHHDPNGKVISQIIKAFKKL